MNVKSKLLIIYNSKTFTLVNNLFWYFFGFIVILSFLVGCIFFVLSIFQHVLLGELINVYGDDKLVDSKVYINNGYEGKMVWDEEYKRTYAKDLNILGQFSFALGLEKYGIRRDALKTRNTTGDIEIKIETPSGKIYYKKYQDMESITYFTHYIKDFEEIK